MGYTHYWNHENLDQAKWDEEFIPLVRRVISTAGVPLGDAYGEGLPVVASGRLALNGKKEDGHESFILRPDPTDFDFCKTARKPYDMVVVAILIIAEQTFPGFRWSSDGDEQDHAEGRLLADLATASRQGA